MPDTITEILAKLQEQGIKVLIALVIMFVSFKLINRAFKIIQNHVTKKEILDKTLTRTIARAACIVIKTLIVLSLTSYLGIDTSSFTALIASFGVAFGLAMNGAVSNIAGGLLLLVTRPYKLDDFVSVAGYEGLVEDINLNYTVLRTFDNKVIHIANGKASTESITNYSKKEIRRVDQVFNVSFDSDYDKARRVILDLAENHEKILKEPAPFVRMTAHGENGMVITSRVWVKIEDYWSVSYDMLEGVIRGFEENSIEIPYSQLDVHLR